ncbi:MAG: MarR family winged helix-turn-helix transcriptional regulator [Hyphomicrobium sp.]|nr:MarR family winged helix-turn-helix transcriptional regulator [Hyphomicrobium sp.]
MGINTRVFVPSESATHLLHRAGQIAEVLFTSAIGDLGITARQFVVLSVVATLEDPSQTDLCDRSGIDRSTLADIVRRLVARGLLTRKRTRQDARMYAVKLTAQGREVLDRALPIAQQVDQQILSVFSAPHRRDFEMLLRKLIESSVAKQAM